jgi:hypothetical protein
MEIHEIKRHLHKKDIVSKLKKPPTEWGIIFASYTLDKGLLA